MTFGEKRPLRGNLCSASLVSIEDLGAKRVFKNSQDIERSEHVRNEIYPFMKTKMKPCYYSYPDENFMARNNMINLIYGEQIAVFAGGKGEFLVTDPTTAGPLYSLHSKGRFHAVINYLETLNPQLAFIYHSG